MLVQNNKRYLHKASDIASYPHFVSSESRQRLSRFDHILWVEHAASGIYWPWLVSAAETEFLARIDAGILAMTPEDQQRAVAMGLVYDHGSSLAEAQSFLTALQRCRQEILDTGYCLLPKLTFDGYVHTVNYYVREVDASLVFDHQVPTRRGEHNAALFSAVHSQLSNLVQSVANTPLKPSYCYMSVYPKGSVLTKHTDRAQCIWNASITFARTHGIWPIHVDGHKGPASIHADIGEVIVYRGTEIPHWRDALPEGKATVCFFHFVDQDYRGALN